MISCHAFKPQRRLLCVMVEAAALAAPVFSQQITISRIEQMPQTPSPYIMRDWRSVARLYDSLVFDFSRTGTYLPLGSIVTTTINYPQHPSFGLHSYVGTTYPDTREAINCLPAVIGATLVGIDKSNHYGRNWALMAEEWFNKRPTQNVYKNGWADESGEDFWYLTTPNVFFYQLNSLYPHTGDFDYQFTMVANRWLQAVRVMGGSTTPWRLPNVNHRGWYLQTMTPYNQGVPQPEAAGALAWLFYHAFTRTGEPKYRIAAEWTLEFLDSYGSNPSYELQLPYGAYTAARMNAEIGTTYNIERMVNWCFDVGPLRSWGAILGTWGGYDVSGLIGEVNGVNDYAFAMNTFEHAGALVPLVRYDDRFARAISKWMLNAANAARLFYSAYLPDSLQDNAAWARQYDPHAVLAYEGLRQFRTGRTPYATGDAIAGGWAQINLGVYGSSHVGIFGGIIDTTNVPMILRLDVLKTDYYHAPAYPTLLFFNPHLQTHQVAIDVGNGSHDLYDAATNMFVRTGVSGRVTFPLAANTAALIAVVPAGGTITYRLDRMLVNDVVVDYRSGVTVANYPPRIKALAPETTVVIRGGTLQLYCTAIDRDSDMLAYDWRASNGTIFGSGSNVVWVAPDSLGTCTLSCVIDDGRGGCDSAATAVEVVMAINHPPSITALTARPRKIDINATSELLCSANDPDGDTLAYGWSAPAGTFSGSGARVSWTAPSTPMDVQLTCTVTDARGGLARDSLPVRVRNLSQTQTGQLVAFYPFNGNAQDASGNGNNGTVYGAQLTSDRNGIPNSAYRFDGLTSSIEVPSSPSLNFQQAASINCWMNVGRFYDREQYPLSHGNWENRWKISISNRRVRWTIKTTAGIKDLDSETEILLGRWYNVTAWYDGSDIELYLDGELDAFGSWSGTILPTALALTIGKVLPNNSSYNFNGVLDDIRLYNYALAYDSIRMLAGGTSRVRDDRFRLLPQHIVLDQNTPNPVSATSTAPSTRITFAIPEATCPLGVATLTVFDLLGREVATLVDEPLQPDTYSLDWDVRNIPSGVYFYRLTTSSGSSVRKMLVLR